MSWLELLFGKTRITPSTVHSYPRPPIDLSKIPAGVACLVEWHKRFARSDVSLTGPTNGSFLLQETPRPVTSGFRSFLARARSCLSATFLYALLLGRKDFLLGRTQVRLTPLPYRVSGHRQIYASAPAEASPAQEYRLHGQTIDRVFNATTVKTPALVYNRACTLWIQSTPESSLIVGPWAASWSPGDATGQGRLQ
jgi:hypothetical protein